MCSEKFERKRPTAGARARLRNAGPQTPAIAECAMTRFDNESLAAVARRARWLVVKTVAASNAGHIGGPLSAIDLLVGLYFRAMSIRPEDPDWPDRDRFILSKGHASIGLYTVMALRGYFDVEELSTFDKGDSRLQGHPDMTKLPGLDASTGSLGQGLSVGAGLALGARLKEAPSHTWVMLGDGEIQEGMVWEAVHIAARYQLTTLTAIIDCNGLQQYGWEPKPDDRADRAEPWASSNIVEMFTAFGWQTIEFDGHDFEAIDWAYTQAQHPANKKPTPLVARTVKGKGVSFMEGSYRWHTAVPSEEQLQAARDELGVPDTDGERA